MKVDSDKLDNDGSKWTLEKNGQFQNRKNGRLHNIRDNRYDSVFIRFDSPTSWTSPILVSKDFGIREGVPCHPENGISWVHGKLLWRVSVNKIFDFSKFQFFSKFDIYGPSLMVFHFDIRNSKFQFTWVRVEIHSYQTANKLFTIVHEFHHDWKLFRPSP